MGKTCSCEAQVISVPLVKHMWLVVLAPSDCQDSTIRSSTRAQLVQAGILPPTQRVSLPFGGNASSIFCPLPSLDGCLGASLCTVLRAPPLYWSFSISHCRNSKSHCFAHVNQHFTSSFRAAWSGICPSREQGAGADAGQPLKDVIRQEAGTNASRMFVGRAPLSGGGKGCLPFVSCIS